MENRQRQWRLLVSVSDSLMNMALEKGLQLGWEGESKRFTAIAIVALDQRSGMTDGDGAICRRAVAIALYLRDLSRWMGQEEQFDMDPLADGDKSKTSRFFSQMLSGCGVDRVIGYDTLHLLKT